MPNTTVPAAGEAMPKITRRSLLGLMAGAVATPSALAATPVLPVDPVELCQHYADQLAAAMELVAPGGDWDVIVDHKTRCAIIVDKKRARELWA